MKKEHETGRPRYDREKLLKIVLFAFMEFGYCSLRFIEKLCNTDIYFIWILDEDKAPSYAKIGDFISVSFSRKEGTVIDKGQSMRIASFLKQQYTTHLGNFSG